jgi:hypothetical protein
MSAISSFLEKKIFFNTNAEPSTNLEAEKKRFPHIVLTSRDPPSVSLLPDLLPTPRNTMISQNYNKLNPFVTEKPKQEMKHLMKKIE